MSELKPELLSQVKIAMKSGDKTRLAALRLISAAVKQIEIDQRKDLTDPEIMTVLEKMKKQRADSIEQYTKAERQDLLEQEEFEVRVINEFLPTPFSLQELEAVVKEAIAATEAVKISDMKKVMEHLKPLVAGRASSKDLSEVARKLLA
jgi:uncharacterized protein